MGTDGDVEKRPGSVGPMFRDNCGWKLALVNTVQSLIVAVCLTVTIYIYWKSDENKEVFILFKPIAFMVGTPDSKPAALSILRNNTVGLRKDNTEIYVHHNGPYILHMEICCIGMDNMEGSGTLQLRVANQVLANFDLKANNKYCVGLFDTVYLWRDRGASLHYSSGDNNLKVTNMTLGLTYLVAGV